MITNDDVGEGEWEWVRVGRNQRRGEALFFFLTLRRGRNDVIASNIVTGQNRYPSEYNW